MVKELLKRLLIRQSSDETGSETIEFVFVFPLLMFTIFAGIDFGWVFYQKIAFEYALASTAWNIDPSMVATGTDEANERNLALVKEYISKQCPDVIAENITLTNISDGGEAESAGIVGEVPVLSVKEYESSKGLEPIETEKLGLKSRKYVHTFVHVQASYEYKFQWIIGIGDFLGVDNLRGNINELRTCGKDFYFSPEAAEHA